MIVPYTYFQAVSTMCIAGSGRRSGGRLIRDENCALSNYQLFFFFLLIFTHVMPGLLHHELNITTVRYRVPGWQCHA
jgi:hypothetical protein